MQAGERSHSLGQLALRYLQHTTSAVNTVLGEEQNRIALDFLPTAEATKYGAEIADVTIRIAKIQESRLQEEGLRQLYDSVEGPLIEVLADMEFHGVYIDLPLLRRLSDEFAARLTSIERQIYELAGGEFNIASPTQVRRVLFDQLRLPVLRRTWFFSSSPATGSVAKHVATAPCGRRYGPRTSNNSRPQRHNWPSAAPP